MPQPRSRTWTPRFCSSPRIEAIWEDYDILFRHWRDYGLAPRIRDRLSIVSALTPELETDAYLEGFREHAWNLFRDRLYDEVPAGADPAAELFSFDLHEENAPHDVCSRLCEAGSSCPVASTRSSSYLITLDPQPLEGAEPRGANTLMGRMR